MLSNIIYSANAVLPIFFLFLFGYFLKTIAFFSKDFLEGCDKFVFRIALPFLVFTQLAFSQKKVLTQKDVYSIVFCVVFVLITAFLLLLIMPAFCKNSAARGAFIQGVYRSNFAVLGLPLAGNLFGADGTRIASFMLAIAIPLYNVLAVVILSINNPEKVNSSRNNTSISSVLKGIIKNPLIIAVVLALPFFIFKFDMPVMFKKSITYIADTATPIALLAIGASFNFKNLKGKLTLALSAVTLKMIIFPFLFVAIAAALGFRNEQLGLVFIVFGSPTAISSYTMAKSMNSDYQLASQIILITSVVSIFTVFLGSFLMKEIGLI